MRTTVVCDNCTNEWELKNLDIEESTVKKGGKVEKCIVQYFRCPKCHEKYIVVVMTQSIRVLTRKHASLLSNHEGMSDEHFERLEKRLKTQITAEESMLLHLYLKQHKDLNRSSLAD